MEHNNRYFYRGQKKMRGSPRPPKQIPRGNLPLQPIPQGQIEWKFQDP